MIFSHFSFLRQLSAPVFARGSALLAASLVLFMMSGCQPKEDASSQSAQGGTVTYDGKAEIHTFLENGDFVVPEGKEINVDILVVGGGGGGGGCASIHSGAGGGAGGFVERNGITLGAGTYQVVIGQGGAGGAGNSENEADLLDQTKKNATNGGNGGNSTFTRDDENSTFNDITAIGGGGGALHYTYPDGDPALNGGAGGSGGGGGYSGNRGRGTAGQGNDGGAGAFKVYWSSGGGGGAGGTALDSTTGISTAGGIGKASSISSKETEVWYAGGGAAGLARDNTAILAGGQGGGGDSQIAGADGTGGGGGGGSGRAPDGGTDTVENRKGARGGNGIVIVRINPPSDSTTD